MKNVIKELSYNPSYILAPETANVRKTCCKLKDSRECLIKIDENKISEFLADTDVEYIKTYSGHMLNNIEFKDDYSELNFHIILHLFNFGHGYRHALHKARGFGAWNTMKSGIEKLYLESPGHIIDSEILGNLDLKRVDYIFDLSLEKNETDEQVLKDLSDLANIIVNTAFTTAEILQIHKYSDFADFFLKNNFIDENKKLSALKFIFNLCSVFPAFNDRRILENGQEVLFLKKAQLAAAEIHQKLGKKDPQKFFFYDIGNISVVCDNVLPCVLKTLGIIVLSDSLEEKIRSGKVLNPGREEAELRAVSIAAVDRIIELSGKRFTPKEIGDYLWTLGKDPQFRKVERHAVKDTCFY